LSTAPARKKNTAAEKIAAAESGSSPDRPSVKEILSAGGGDAEKFRDLLGVPLTITGFEDVATKNGDSMQFAATDDDDVEHVVWAPSIVERHIRQLNEHGYLPYRAVPTAIEGASGREYFSLEEPADA
jgi:hypothetical protein